ncbi:MAG TPA: hypothetical protein VJN70_03475, partial [Gemmatimonadaceae bacterium]|nr:hypothetical protein [Gemmatimonadaceae bacterium]
RFPKWWLPDGVEFVTAIPKTSVGKFQKREIRNRYRDYFAQGDDSTVTAASPLARVAAGKPA